MTDADLAAHLAETAGRLLLEVRASGLFSAKAPARPAPRSGFIVNVLPLISRKERTFSATAQSR